MKQAEILLEAIEARFVDGVQAKTIPQKLEDIGLKASPSKVSDMLNGRHAKTLINQRLSIEEKSLKWLEKAKCNGSDLKDFFSEDEQKSKQVIKDYCDKCEVRMECFKMAWTKELILTKGSQLQSFGIFGGTTSAIRKKIFRIVGITGNAENLVKEVWERGSRRLLKYKEQEKGKRTSSSLTNRLYIPKHKPKAETPDLTESEMKYISLRRNRNAFWEEIADEIYLMSRQRHLKSKIREAWRENTGFYNEVVV